MTRLLEVDHLVKRFGGLTATNDLTFHVEEGESLGLIGPNGAGKTTIFSLIMGELQQDAGTIRLRDRDIAGLATHERIKAGVSRTYQVPRPFAGMNVAENIRVGLMPDNLWSMLTRTHDPLAELALARSVGFEDADIERLPSKLSMGDLRKLELARTLATEPDVLLLDEVFAGLTVGEIAQISELLDTKRREGMTFIIVSHDLRSLEPLVDRVVAMSFGQVIAEGSFQDVTNDEGVRTAYLGN